MNEMDITALRKTLGSRNLGQDALLEVEAMGTPAFGALEQFLESGELREQEKVNALRALGILSRHACRDRVDEVVNWAMRLTSDGSKDVRSAAAEAAIWSFMTLEQTSGTRSKDVILRLRDALSGALENELAAESTQFVRRFLEERGFHA
jgi:hypothetical protein